MERTRSRAQLATNAPRIEAGYNGGHAGDRYVLFVNRETTTDEEHPWYAWKHVRENERAKGFTTGVEVGGNFTSKKTTGRLITTDTADLRYFFYKGDYLYKFRGPLIPNIPPPITPLRSDVRTDVALYPGYPVYAYDSMNGDTRLWPSVSETDEELAVLGASLVSKLAPTAPHNSVYTSLGELRNDGLPSLPFLSFLKGGKKLPEKVGDEYLNYQFGIAPTVSDIKSILITIRDADILWRQYLRDSGRLVRRRMDMDPVVTTETGIITSNSSYVPQGTSAGHWSSVGPITHTTTTTRKRWFSAAFLYYVDKSSLTGMEGWIERSNYLYGWKPTPSSAYNLTAWTWLLDWFTNTGDVIDNISLYLQDPFLTRWAYIMEETSVVRTISQSLIDNQGYPRLASVQFETNIKKRRRVNPLHLGFKGEELNSHQLAILAALGLSKGRDPGLM